MADLVIRRGTPDDLRAVTVADGRGFGFHYGEQDVEDLALIIEMERFLLACAPDGEIVGVTGSFDMTVTPPGGAPLRTEGVSWVSVSMLHRRRGVLRSLMDAQLRAFAADGLPVAILTASEGGIYGRFGYGVATTVHDVEIDTGRAVFRGDVPDPGGVAWAGTEDVRRHAPAIHRRWCATHPGAVSRTDGWWERLLLDREYYRRGASGLFHLLHPDGYAGFRVRGDTCVVEDLFAVTDEAHVALWRALLARDLVRTVTTRVLTGDDPLPLLLTDARAVGTVHVADGVWARPLDVSAVLAARRYAVEINTVLEVQDPFLPSGVGVAGRYHLHGGPDGAECTPTDRSPDVGLGAAALGTLAFGGTRAATLARAGLVHADPAALRRLDAATLPAREPRGGTNF